MMLITISAETRKLKGKTENVGVCTKERKCETAELHMATLCSYSLEGESGGRKHGGDEGRRLCWKFAAVSARVMMMMFITITARD